MLLFSNVLMALFIGLLIVNFIFLFSFLYILIQVVCFYTMIFMGHDFDFKRFYDVCQTFTDSVLFNGE